MGNILVKKSDKESVIKNYLIIPASGKSSRFPNMPPKWMLIHPSGKQMIYHVMMSMDLDHFDEIYIVILKAHCEKYDAKNILLNLFRDITKIKICILEKETSCSPETITECIKLNNIDGLVTVKDCDCLVKYHDIENTNAIVGLDIFRKTINNVLNKSFVQVDSNDCLITIVEKQKISDIICCGVYRLHSSKIVFYYNELVDCSSSEIYFSHLISSSISSGDSYKLIYANEFLDWGTLDDWEQFINE